MASSNAVSIYPNPSNGSFVIEPNSATKQTMQVCDVNDKMVLSQPINGKTTIDASSLNEGVYNISLLSNDGVANKRLVIVR
ncbi:MAG TPA: T9SS type A sorting domain-containing protein [Bacteroidia bacterium]